MPLFSSQGYVLKGWVDLTSNKPHVVKKSIKYLEQGTQDTKDVLGLMGKVGGRWGNGDGRVGGLGGWGVQVSQVDDSYPGSRQSRARPFLLCFTVLVGVHHIVEC